MDATISAGEWLALMEKEYLKDFVYNGGSTIKFLVSENAKLRHETMEALIRRGEEEQFLVSDIDSQTTPLHRIEAWIFAIARSIDWPDLADRIIARFAREKGYSIPPYGENFFNRLAQSNKSDVSFLVSQIRPDIENSIYKNNHLCREIQIFMSRLCMNQINGGSDGNPHEDKNIIKWIHGETKTGEIKAYGITSNINRSNARYILRSISYLIKLAGHHGLLIGVDATRLSIDKNPRDGLSFYTRTSVMDTYEVLRQFIDTTGDLHSVAIVLFFEPSFVDDNPRGRGYGIYEALRGRIFNEFVFRAKSNPLISLVMLGE